MPNDRGRASSVEFYSKGLRVEVEYHIEEWWQVSEALESAIIACNWEHAYAAPEFILSDNVIGEGRKGETAGDR